MADEQSAIEKAGFKEEVAEEYNIGAYGAYVKTGFPQPFRRYRLVYESQQASIEHTYFWVYNHTTQDFGFGDVIKTLDTFQSSENSSFWGLTEQRKGIQQDKASQFMAIIGRMTKELFQIVREVRILKERLHLYEGSKNGKQADDIALKGLWVDFAQSGGRQGAMNIYTMAQQLGFGTLPDLFFSTHIKDDDDVAKVVDDKCKEFNEKVREVLKRTLASYRVWKIETEKELQVREKFTIRYLRQHWAAIRMYISWVKPYLRNVQKLSGPNNDSNPELISSFEGALMEIEFLARKAARKPGAPAQTLLATFRYRVKPQLQFQTEYQRGAVHVGRVEFTIRAYGWSDAEVKKYLAYRERETLELIGMVDTSLKDALDALGEELLKYLEEAGEDVTSLRPKKEEKKEEKMPSQSIFEPFAALFGGFKELATMPFEGLMDAGKSDKEKSELTSYGDKGMAKGAAGGGFNVFKNYKKAHGMPAW